MATGVCHLGYYVDQSSTGWLSVLAEAGARVIDRPRRWCQDWALWQVSRPALILVFIVNSVAVIVTIATAFLVRIESDDLMRFALLAACAWAAIEFTRHIERKRSYAHKVHVAYIDTKSVWSFAAVVVLPPALASAMVVVTYFIAWLRVKRGRPNVPYRWIFSCATVLCGTQAAVVVLSVGMHNYPGVPGVLSLEGLLGLGAIAVAAILRWILNHGLVMVAIAVSSPTARVRDLFSDFSEQLLEAGAMGLGLVAAAVVVTNPLVLPGIVIAMIALHRGFLVSQYQRASRTDTKTGLASVGRWHEFAEHTLERARDREGSMGLLIVDLDHFKAINDTYGHPFGDKVLRAVADELRAEIRDDDACGRWGGEEFAIALPDVGSEQNLHHIAERVRRRIESIVIEPPGDVGTGEVVNVTASVGGAIYPAEGITALDELLLAADTALYEAKNSGRNAVRLSPTVLETDTDTPESTGKPQQISNPRPSAN